MGDQLGGAERRAGITGRTIGVVAACALLMCAFAPGAFADGLKPDPSPATGGLGPDSAATPAPATPATRTAPKPKPVVRATPSTPVAPVVTRTVVVPAPAAPAPAAVTRIAPKPKPKVARVAKPKPKPKPKPHVSRPHRVLPFGVRAAVAGANKTVTAASLALPAALAFVALIAASSGFLRLVVRLRREMTQI